MLYKIDVKRLLCPMPVIRLSELINTIQTGDLIEMVATDPGVLHDIPAWCKVHGHKVLSMKDKSSDYFQCPLDGQKSNEIVLLVEKLC